MKVLKFGGTSVAGTSQIKQVGDILSDYYRKEVSFTVIVSALGGMTDLLFEMSRLASVGDGDYRLLYKEFCERHKKVTSDLLTGEYRVEALSAWEESFELLKNLLYGIFLLKEATPRTLDLVVSFGERSAAFLIATYLKQEGLPATFLDARYCIITDNNFGGARVNFERTNEALASYFATHEGIQVITGFLGATVDGLTTTLGRGGSDYTASIVAAALDADEIEIWTDVNGVLTADPGKVKRAFTIPFLTYGEAMEMSHFGAKVIYPPTLHPAMAKGIPLRIRNTFDRTFEGSLVTEYVEPSPMPVKGISSIHEVALITLQGSGMIGIPGTANRLFESLARVGCNVILITQGSSEHSITFAVKREEGIAAKNAVADSFALELEKGLIEPVRLENDLSVVAVIGEEMRYRPGIAGQLFSALGKNGINVMAIAQGSSELNISVVVAEEDEGKALNVLHDAFFLSDIKEVHLFMIGVGLIGQTLIKQMKEQAPFLRDRQGLAFKLIGLANSRRMTFSKEGIPFDTWQHTLDNTEAEKMDIDRFVEYMHSINLPSSVFIDCTASAEVAGYYEEILHENIAIVTPNKIATSSSLDRYRRLKFLSYRRNVPFLYETNVGAGLPILTTIKDLMDSGDRFIKVEGVLSGSLSYIFNTYKPGMKFSEVVKDARDRGYTEPDPREDLSGNDVRRKLIILGREIGLPLEEMEVEVASLLPPNCINATDVASFFDELEKENSHFDKMLEQSLIDGAVLRFIGKLEEGKARISLEAVKPDSPFYSLSGSDNMVVFKTERYKDRPLVVRGPGAGADVTAAGVFAELIKVGNN